MLANRCPSLDRYVEETRRASSDDVLARLAATRFLAGALTGIMSVVRLAATLFGAAQETIAHWIGSGVSLLAVLVEWQAIGTMRRPLSFPKEFGGACGCSRFSDGSEALRARAAEAP